MKKDNLKPGFDGLPAIKTRYETNEKILIVEAAEKYGIETVVNAYGLKLRSLLGWKRYYGTKSNPEPKKNISENADKIIIQSPAGQEITPEEIIKKVGDVEKIYVRVDENAAYWVSGEKSGSVNLW